MVYNVQVSGFEKKKNYGHVTYTPQHPMSVWSQYIPCTFRPDRETTVTSLGQLCGMSGAVGIFTFILSACTTSMCNTIIKTCHPSQWLIEEWRDNKSIYVHIPWNVHDFSLMKLDSYNFKILNFITVPINYYNTCNVMFWSYTLLLICLVVTNLILRCSLLKVSLFMYTYRLQSACRVFIRPSNIFIINELSLCR